MKPRPNIYSNVLIMGGGTPQTDGPPVARLGGTWAQPDLALSYLLAARCVIEKAEELSCQNEVGLPAAYLQRHAFEIALKDLLEAAYMVKRDEEWVSALGKNAKSQPPELAKVPAEHRFGPLLTLITKALKDIKFDDVPTELVTMATRLEKAEGFEPTRTRYLKLRRGDRSFPESVLLHVGEIQDQLEALFEKFFVYQPAEGAGVNLATALAHEGMGLDEAILRIVPIDEL